MVRSGWGALRRCLVCACVGLLASVGSSRADDIKELKAKLEAQQRQIQELKQMLQGTWDVLQRQPTGPTAAGAVAQPAPGPGGERPARPVPNRSMKLRSTASSRSISRPIPDPTCRPATSSATSPATASSCAAAPAMTPAFIRTGPTSRVSPSRCRFTADSSRTTTARGRAGGSPGHPGGHDGARLQ